MTTSPVSTDESLEKNFTVSQVAQTLVVSDYTVRQWLKDGKLVGFKINGRGWRISETELKIFINKRHGAGE